MIRPSLLAVAIVLALAAPAAAKCVVLPDGGDEGYPNGQEALLLCQQQELADTVDTQALDEQLRAMRRQLLALQLQQQRLMLRPIEPYRLPGL